AGKIILVNRAWKRFAVENGLRDPDFCVGKNYFEECLRAAARGSKGAAAVAAGIRGVLEGAVDSFKSPYACHSPEQRRWFELIASPLGSNPVEGAVTLHVNITDSRRLARRFAKRQQDAHNVVVMCAWCKSLRDEN